MLKETLISFIAWKWNISEEIVLEYENNIGKLAFLLFDNDYINELGLCEADLEFVMLIMDLEEFFAIEIDDDEINKLFDIIETKIPEFEEKLEFENIHECWEYCFRVGRIHLIDMKEYKFGNDIQEYIKERKMSPMKFNDFILTEGLNIDIHNPKLKRISPSKIQFEQNGIVFSAEIRDIQGGNTYDSASVEFYDGEEFGNFDITNKHNTNVMMVYSLAWSAMLTFIDEYMPLTLTLTTSTRKVKTFNKQINYLLENNLIMKAYILNSYKLVDSGAVWTLKRKDY